MLKYLHLISYLCITVVHKPRLVYYPLYIIETLSKHMRECDIIMIKFKNRKGSSLILVIMISFFSVTISTIVAVRVGANAMAAQIQNEHTRAYYLVLAGMEIGMAAVTKRSLLDDRFPIMDHFGNNNFIGSYEDEIFQEVLFFGPGGHPDLPDYNNSWIKITIYATYQDGTRILADSPTIGQTVWVEVHVIATHYNHNGVGRSHAGRIRFNTSEPQWYIREIEDPRVAAHTP